MRSCFVFHRQQRWDLLCRTGSSSLSTKGEVAVISTWILSNSRRLMTQKQPWRVSGTWIFWFSHTEIVWLDGEQNISNRHFNLADNDISRPWTWKMKQFRLNLKSIYMLFCYAQYVHSVLFKNESIFRKHENKFYLSYLFLIPFCSKKFSPFDTLGSRHFCQSNSCHCLKVFLMQHILAALFFFLRIV